MPTKTIKFVKEKDTKNTVKFSEVPDPGQPPVVGNLYLQKWFVGGAQAVSLNLQLAG